MTLQLKERPSRYVPDGLDFSRRRTGRIVKLALDVVEARPGMDRDPLIPILAIRI
jgi:hypothetical protein